MLDFSPEINKKHIKCVVFIGNFSSMLYSCNKSNLTLFTGCELNFSVIDANHKYFFSNGEFFTETSDLMIEMDKKYSKYVLHTCHEELS